MRALWIHIIFNALPEQLRHRVFHQVQLLLEGLFLDASDSRVDILALAGRDAEYLQ